MFNFGNGLFIKIYEISITFSKNDQSIDMELKMINIKYVHFRVLDIIAQHRIFDCRD